MSSFFIKYGYPTSQGRPTCVNPGCKKPVMQKGGTIDNPTGWRVHCGHCQKASYGAHAHAVGVTPFKTGRCSNTTGHLGFPCCVDWDKAEGVGLKISTEIDHKNGDPNDNRIRNLQELCSICHKEKGKRNGDYDGYR